MRINKKDPRTTLATILLDTPTPERGTIVWDDGRLLVERAGVETEDAGIPCSLKDAPSRVLEAWGPSCSSPWDLQWIEED